MPEPVVLVVKRGKSQKWTTEQLVEIPVPTIADIETAQVIVQTDTPELADLLNAASKGLDNEQ